MKIKVCFIILSVCALLLFHCNNTPGDSSTPQNKTLTPGKKEVNSEDKDTWKTQNDRGNRYEGIKGIEVSAPPIQLIAFFIYKEEYKWDDILKVRFYLRNPSDVQLTAQELTTVEFYWMEAKPQNWEQGWNEFSPWPVKDVLAELNINPDNLGVLVRLDKNYGSGLVSPVILCCQSSQSTQRPSNIVQYKAYFRPGISLSGGFFEVYKERGNGEIIRKEPIGSQVPPGPFPIVFELNSNWQGWVRLRIVVHPKDEKTPGPSREYDFYHLPIVSSSV